MWQTARELALGVYRAAESQPPGRDRTLTNQMRRAAVSIGSNIAEGSERGSRRQEIEACYTAKGSACELRSQAILAHDVGLIDPQTYEGLHEMCESCSRQLHAYVAYLRSSTDTHPGWKMRAEAASAAGRSDRQVPLPGDG